MSQPIDVGAVLGGRYKVTEVVLASADGDVVLVRVNENGNGLAVQARRLPSSTAAADPQPVASGSRPRDRIRRIARVGAS